MNIRILSFGFGDLDKYEKQYYKSYGRDLHAEDNSGDVLIDQEGSFISGDSGIALGYCREFQRLGHDAATTHFENAERAAEEADLVLGFGRPSVYNKYQPFDDTDAIYWWWVCEVGDSERIGTEEFINKYIVDSAYDAILTNGRPVLSHLYEHRPCRHLYLGYDSVSLWKANGKVDYNPDIVYVGHADIKKSDRLELILDPASKYNLEIYGYGWEDTKYSEYHQGILPRRHIGALYSSATVVLGIHGNYIHYGMINDRVFEALATDSILIDRYHPQLEVDRIGDFINLVSSKEELEKMLAEIFAGSVYYKRQAERGGEFVRSNYTYADQCVDILNFHTEVL